jgi:hypothetical protein
MVFPAAAAVNWPEYGGEENAEEDVGDTNDGIVSVTIPWSGWNWPGFTPGRILVPVASGNIMLCLNGFGPPVACG